MEGGPWGLVLFTPRTTGQIWILGFAAWRAFEAYRPYVFLRIPIAPSAMSDDQNQVKAEKALSDDLRKVRELKEIQNLEEFTWPSDMPEPGPALPATTRERAIVDRIKIATAFTFLHEVRHAMFMTMAILQASSMRSRNATDSLGTFCWRRFQNIAPAHTTIRRVC